MVFRGVGYVVRRDQDRGSYQAVLRLHHDCRCFKLLHIFNSHADGSSGPPSVQKNWGFMEFQEKLILIYTALPCTTIYEVLTEKDFQLRLLSNVCYKDKESRLASEIFFAMERAHNSAHPVIWKHNGQREILMMIHTRETLQIDGFNHWLVRIDYESLRITHVSHGIVFGTSTYHSEGPIGGAIIVGTISVVSTLEGDYLHIFGGEGDVHCIYHTVALDSIIWLPIADVTDIQEHRM